MILRINQTIHRIFWNSKQTANGNRKKTSKNKVTAGNRNHRKCWNYGSTKHWLYSERLNCMKSGLPPKRKVARSNRVRNRVPRWISDGSPRFCCTEVFLRKLPGQEGDRQLDDFRTLRSGDRQQAEYPSTNRNQKYRPEIAWRGGLRFSGALGGARF